MMIGRQNWSEECENKLNETWSSDNIDYIEEEKQITLKILEIAGTLEKAET